MGELSLVTNPASAAKDRLIAEIVKSAVADGARDAVEIEAVLARKGFELTTEQVDDVRRSELAKLVADDLLADAKWRASVAEANFEFDLAAYCSKRLETATHDALTEKEMTFLKGVLDAFGKKRGMGKVGVETQASDGSILRMILEGTK